MVKAYLVILTAAAVGVLCAASPANASPSSTTVDHWGSYFGDHVSADGDTTSSPTPITLPGTIKQIATSNSDEYALLNDGTVWAWGQGAYGELGDASEANSFNTPVQVLFPSGVTIASIPSDAMPFDTGLALDTSGHVWGWGRNQSGELCLGNATEQDTPVELPLSNVTLLAGAGPHADYDSGGAVYTCGGNQSGDLGDGMTTASLTPARVPLPTGQTVVSLVAAFENGGALMSNGEYYDWGSNDLGQLGDGNTSDSNLPVLVHGLGHVTQVAEGGSYVDNGQTLVMMRNGNVRGWGADGFGQLGDGRTSPGFHDLPILVTPPAGVTYASVVTAGYDSYAISTSGTVYAWGRGMGGQIGNGSSSTVLVPTLVDSGASMISATANNVAVAG
jgi:alpha-tubulin suppressor-like RCC1 family protein